MTHLQEKLKKIAKGVGPGLVSGAADDDPSGILTYLQSGFALGFRMLWLTFVALPLMYAVQEMAARIGFVTDKGLVKVVKEHYAKWILYAVGIASTIVITVNIGADLIAIGAVLEKLTAVSRLIWLPAVSLFILGFTIFLSYPKFASLLKWLTLTLFAYVATALFTNIDWPDALKATVIPQLAFDKEYILLMVAFIGTTISPYLCFWQADEEVEERNEEKKERHLKRFLVTRNELKHLRRETFWGMAFSQVIAWFMIATAGQIALTHGLKEITSFDQAAVVLQPLLGNAAFLVFGIGIIGTGLLAIPVLAGSVGYIIAEIFGWKEGIDKSFRQAKEFYLVIIGATAVGMGLNFLHIDPIKLLIYTAVLYALITPPLVYLIIHMSNNKKIMGERVSSPLVNVLGWLTFGFTLLAVIAYFIFR